MVDLIMNHRRRACLIWQWSAGACLVAAAAATVGMSTAHADTPDDVLGQAISDLNQGTALLDAAPTADLSAQQASILSEQVALVAQEDQLITTIGTSQEGLSSADQTFLANADEHLVTAAQNLLSADQGFVTADEAGDLSGNGFVSADLTTVEADLGLLSADLRVFGATVFATFDPSIGITDAASAAATGADSADLLSEATTNLTDANQLLGQLDVSGVNEVAFPEFVNAATLSQDLALQQISSLSSAESTISSYDGGVLSSLVTRLFTDVDQQWYQASEAVLAADQGLEAAVGSDSGLDAAQFASLIADVHFLGDAFHSLPIEFAASLMSF